MDTEKRTYNRQTPEQKLAKLEEAKISLLEKVNLSKAESNPLYASFFTMRNDLKGMTSKAGIQLGKSTIALPYKNRLTTAKLEMINAQISLNEYIREFGTSIITQIGDVISNLLSSEASETEINQAFLNLPAFDEMSALQQNVNDAEHNYAMVQSERISRSAPKEESTLSELEE